MRHIYKIEEEEKIQKYKSCPKMRKYSRNEGYGTLFKFRATFVLLYFEGYRLQVTPLIYLGWNFKKNNFKKVKIKIILKEGVKTRV